MNIKAIFAVGAVVILVVGGLFISGFLPLGIGRVDIEPVTQRHWKLEGKLVGNYDGGAKKSYELITNPVGSTKTRSAFLLAKTDYGESEFVTAQGYLWYARGLEDVPFGRGATNEGAYRIYHKSPNSASWTLLADETGNKVNWINYNNPKKVPLKSGPLPQIIHRFDIAESITFSLLGNHPGAIKVDFVGFYRWDWFKAWRAEAISSDEAEVLPSGGLIEVTGDKNTYEIGESLKMHVTTDYSGTTVGEQNKGYMVKVRDPDGDVVWIKDLSDDYDGHVYVEIRDDWYDPDRVSNQFKFELVNQMRDLGVVSFFTIDVSAKAPADCSISFDVNSGKLEAGSQLKITFTAPEKTGSVPIEKFKYCVFYGQKKSITEPPSGSSNWIRPWTTVDASKTGSTYKASVTVTTPSYEGYITVLGVSIGEGSRASLDIKAKGVYLWVGKEPDDSQLDPENLNEGNYRGGRTNDFWDWIRPAPVEGKLNWFAIIIAALAFVICLIAAILLPIPGGPFGKFLLIVLGVALAVVIYYWLNGGF